METSNSLFTVPPPLPGVLLLIAMPTGFIDSVASNGKLFTTPTLMAMEVSPINALAINRLQACGGSTSTTVYFIRRKVISLSNQRLNIAMIFVGSMSGAPLMQHVQVDVLRQVLPILIICIDFHFLLMPKLGEEDRQRRMYGLPLALTIGGRVGLCDGFSGPAAKSFYALAFVMLRGFNLAKATIHAESFNTTSNIGGSLLFILGGKVTWATGFIILVGQFPSVHTGSRPVLGKEQKLIRPMIVITPAAMSAELFYDSHGQGTLRWLGIN